jgi:multicomponent K+:H+ antiporter subunit D
MNDLIVVPVVLPLVVAAVMVLLGDRRRTIKAALGLASTLGLLAVAIALLRMADTPAPGGNGAWMGVYLLGGWPARFGIVLVVDRLAALMLLLTSFLALASVVFSLARWHRAGAHFHPLFQLQLMGLNGAFLTGDLFNLFVFFEVLLAASYGLALHGSGRARVRAGMHYIAVNLVASLLFLIGASLIYGVAGTLNMADLARRIPTLAGADRMLLESGAAILGVVFLVKAAMWPLGFWLPTTYAAASPPAAALFSIMSKVGIYAVLRLWLLLFGAGSGPSAGFGADWLLVGGILTIAFGMIGVLATQDMARLAGASVMVSSGTLLAALGAGQAAVTGGALFYMVSSVLAISALFLLVELVERGRGVGADVLAVTMEALGEVEPASLDEPTEVGIAIPASMAILGIAFLSCALVLAGLPPLSGFIGKFAMLTVLLNPAGLGGGGTVPAASWALLAALVVSGLATVIAMTRAGIRVFWAPLDGSEPRVRVIEIAPIGLLLLLCLGLTVRAGPIMRYMQATAQSLEAPRNYIDSVLSAPSTRATEGKGGA